MASLLLATATAALLASTAHRQSHNGNYSGMVYGATGGADTVDYIRQRLPYRNGTEYPLQYTRFNWTDPTDDNGLWTVRCDTADNWLPGNLSTQKVVVTSYALQWSGQETYSNLSAKINNDTDILRAAGVRQAPPNMCFGFMGHDSDFQDSVKKKMEVFSNDPCTSMMGEECMASLSQAFTSGFDDESCSFALASVPDDLPRCEDTWAKKVNGFTFLSSSIANGSQASNASYASPKFDDVIAQDVQLHNPDDNSTYEKELQRTQFVVFKESGKEAQVQCMRFEAASWRLAASGGPLLLSAGVVLAMAFEII
ncbi:hypothetical protein Slin14017_G090470 [Septoria linicola]|nr:hypothetical protein Slin14017_G090470 [Septoria linicola]